MDAIVNRFGFFCRGNQKGISKRKCNYQKVLSKWGMEKDREVAPPPGDMCGEGETIGICTRQHSPHNKELPSPQLSNQS